jgi:hypothetical protein
MTVLPVPALRVAYDATEITSPQGDSPALQSAPEITLAEVVEDMAHNLQLCRMQTQEAHLIAQDSLAQATALRTEVKHLRSQLADLESIVMRELIQDLPAEDQNIRRRRTNLPVETGVKQSRTRRVRTLTVARPRHRPMKKGQQPSLRRTRECPWDAASAVLSSSKRGSLNIKGWCRIGRIA